MTGNRRGCCPDLKCRGEVHVCVSVLRSLLTSLTSAKRMWDDKS